MPTDKLEKRPNETALQERKNRTEKNGITQQEVHEFIQESNKSPDDFE